MAKQLLFCCAWLFLCFYLFFLLWLNLLFRTEGRLRRLKLSCEQEAREMEAGSVSGWQGGGALQVPAQFHNYCLVPGPTSWTRTHSTPSSVLDISHLRERQWVVASLLQAGSPEMDLPLLSLNLTTRVGLKCTTWELQVFIWVKMRIIAWETVPQTALRNCSKEVGGKVSIYVILMKGEYM